MADVFRVVRISDAEEMHRSIDLIGACIVWAKNSKELRVEQLPVGSETPTREVPPKECCSALRNWLPTNPHLTPSERTDMKTFIDEACSARS
jgi:hypothetical protein